VSPEATTDPCPLLSWFGPTIDPMSATVNGTPETQPIAAFSTYPVCGSIGYLLNCPETFMKFENFILTLAPTSDLDVGTHTCEIEAYLDSDTTYFTTRKFTVDIGPDPCLTVTWNNPTIEPMSGTVSSSAVTQLITAFSTNPSCGTISYEVTCPRLFMTFDLPTMTLKLAPTDAADVGSHSC
jgi:hypothetical protein